MLGLTLFVGCQKEEPQPTYELNQLLPDFLDYLVPEPGTSLSLKDYQTGQHSGSYYSPVEAKNRICARIITEPILEPGDFYSTRNQAFDFLPERLNIFVDGQQLEWNLDEMAVGGGFQLRNEDMVITAETAMNNWVCWLAELQPGEHTAVMNVQKTSGESIEYAWSFTLTDE
jgi:hypothetical protein